MVDIECQVARPGGVTLVAVRVDNRVDAPGVEAHRVRLASRLDGPVWPPRVEGVPAAPWDGDVAELVVPTGRLGSLGFASPAESPESPDDAVEIVDVEPAEPPASRGPTPSADATPADVLRVLGDPSPPRDVVDETPRTAPAATERDPETFGRSLASSDAGGEP